MFFGQRKKVDKAAEAQKKRRLKQSDSENSDEEESAKKDSDSEDPKEDIACTVCRQEADVYCFECKFYFCPADFNSVHAGLEGALSDSHEPPSKRHTTTKEQSTPPKKAPPHKFRALIGLEPYRLEMLAHGWDVASSEPQSVIYARRLADQRSAALAKQKATDEVHALESKKRREEENRALEAALLAKRQADAEYEAVQQEAEMRRKKGVRIHGWKEDERTDELWAKAKVFKPKRF